MSGSVKVCAAALMVSLVHPVGALAISSSQLQKLELIVEDGSKPEGMKRLGLASRYLRSLRNAHQKCELSTYDYGGTLKCLTTSGKTAYIGISAVPTRAPEFASITDVRPDGVNSSPHPVADIAAFMENLIKVGPHVRADLHSKMRDPPAGASPISAARM